MRDMQQEFVYVFFFFPSFSFFLENRRHFHAVQSDGRIKASQAHFSPCLRKGGRKDGRTQLGSAATAFLEKESETNANERTPMGFEATENREEEIGARGRGPTTRARAEDSGKRHQGARRKGRGDRKGKKGREGKKSGTLLWL